MQCNRYTLVGTANQVNEGNEGKRISNARNILTSKSIHESRKSSMRYLWAIGKFRLHGVREQLSPVNIGVGQKVIITCARIYFGAVVADRNQHGNNAYFEQRFASFLQHFTGLNGAKNERASLKKYRKHHYAS